MNRKKIFLFAGLFLAMNLEASEDVGIKRGGCHSSKSASLVAAGLQVLDRKVGSSPDSHGSSASDDSRYYSPRSVGSGASGKSDSSASRERSGSCPAFSSRCDSAVPAPVSPLAYSEHHYTLGAGRQVVPSTIAYDPETHALVAHEREAELTRLLKEMHDLDGSSPIPSARPGSPLTLARSLHEKLKAKKDKDDIWGFGAPGTTYMGAGVGGSNRLASPTGPAVTDFSNTVSTGYTSEAQPAAAKDAELKAGIVGFGFGLGAAGLVAYLKRR